MGKAARVKVKKATTKDVSEAPKVLTKGQRVRKEKREAQAWKKTILESVIRNKQIDEVGVALGTMDDLAAAIDATPAPVQQPKKSKGCLKKNALAAKRMRDLETLHKITSYQPFINDPIGTVQTHLKNVSK